jgi:phosphoesterase RecJ-like protein
MNSISELQELLNVPRNIIITTHQRPDGDAIGSSLALYHYLQRKGHRPTVISPTDYPEFLHWLPGNPSVVISTKEPKKSKQLVEEASVIFCADFNKLNRLDELGELIKASSAKKILIDHHLEPDPFSDFQFWNVNALQRPNSFMISF